MGYGRRAMDLLIQYYEGNIPSLSENGEETAKITSVSEDKVGFT